MNTSDTFDDEILFPGEETIVDKVAAVAMKPWKVMIVDDEESVHAVTRMVLADFIFEGKGIEFISAYSAAEAKRLLDAHPDVAIILLDVVMERDDSGLLLVRHIREVLDNRLIRIILRTGQPGIAPQEKIIVEYDINDYTEKTDLTSQKLFAIIISALRCYRDIMESVDLSRQLQVEIAERRQVEDALRTSEGHWRTLVQTIPDLIWLKDTNGVFLSCNKIFERLLGAKEADITGKTDHDFVDKELADFFIEHDRKAMLAGKPTSNEEWVTFADDGHRAFLETIKTPMYDSKGILIGVLGIGRDITRRKQAEDALQESEEKVRRKLQAILEPEGEIGTLELSDIIDNHALQTMMEEFYRLTKIGIGILDVHGNVLVGVGWQDICTKFHRIHPDTLINCIESDTELTKGLPAGTTKAYHCKNNLWDIMTPIEVGGRHLGNVCLGQFFYEDESPDYAQFRAQARKYGFNEADYLAALDCVPRWTRETVDATMAFYANLSKMISSLGYSTVKLARTLSQKDAALRQLDENRAFQDSLLETIPIPVFYKDSEGRYLGMNRACEDFFGKSKEDFKGKSVFDIHPPELARIYHAKDSELFEKQGSQIYESKIMNARGNLRYVIFHKATLTDTHGSIIGLIGAILDITARKQAKEKNIKLQAQLQQAQKMEAVGQLAGGVAHDFNNMLGVILGHAEMAMEQVDLLQPIRADLEEIRKAAHRSADLTRQLLAFARKQTIAPQVLDLNETVEGMLKMLRRLIGEDLDLAWLPTKDLWPVMVDPSQIDQILANLCINARDAISDVGKVTIETKNGIFDEDYCAAHAGFVPGEYVMLALSDNGRGMDKETQARIFEPFFTTKETGKGTGLGLATVYGIVKQNNGFINVYSEPGRGTTFTIYLPRHEGEITQIHEVASGEPSSRGHESILLVEDEQAILHMTKRMLEMQGYTVFAIGTPGEAIRMAEARSCQIDLLITDVVMPGMNGRDLAKRLSSLYPNLKCLFMSGYTANIIAHHGVLDPGVDFIQKPFSKKNLVTKVRDVLKEMLIQDNGTA